MGGFGAFFFELFGEISGNGRGSLHKKAVWMYLIRSFFGIFGVSPGFCTVGIASRDTSFSSVASEMSRTHAARENGINCGI